MSSFSRVRAQRDRGDVTATGFQQLAEFSHERKAIFSGHPKITDQYVHGVAGEHGQRRGRRVGREHARAGARERAVEHHPRIFVVIDDQYADAGQRARANGVLCDQRGVNAR